MITYMVKFLTSKDREEAETFDRVTNSEESVMKLVESFLEDDKVDTLIMQVVKITQE